MTPRPAVPPDIVLGVCLWHAAKYGRPPTLTELGVHARLSGRRHAHWHARRLQQLGVLLPERRIAFTPPVMMGLATIVLHGRDPYMVARELLPPKEATHG